MEGNGYYQQQISASAKLAAMHHALIAPLVFAQY